MLLKRLDRLTPTLEDFGRESAVLEDLKGLDAELIRMQYEVPPPA